MISKNPFRKTTNLNFWVITNAGFETRKILENEINNFRKIFPHYTISITVNPWSQAWDDLMLLVKKKKETSLPDIVQIGSTWSGTLAYLGAIQEITAYIDEGIQKDFIPQALETCYYPGTKKIFSVPWFSDVRALYYRTDVMKEINANVESLDNWNSFMDVCSKIDELRKMGRRIYPLRLSGQMAGILIHDLAPWVWSAGGDFLTADGSRAIFNQEPASIGIRWYFDLIKNGYIPFNMYDGLITAGTFFSGQFAMQFSGMWPVSSIFNHHHPDYNRLVSNNYGVTLVPKGLAGRYTFFGGSNLAITKFCSQNEEAMELLKFLISPTSQVRHAKSIGMFPSTMSSFQQHFGQNLEVGSAFKASLECARTLPRALTLGTIEKIVGTMADNILRHIRYGKYTAKILQDELNQAAEEANSILSIYEA
ncbi:MAG: extracellular solute-binding protein [bacterium]